MGTETHPQQKIWYQHADSDATGSDADVRLLIPGDINLNGIVNLEDFVIFKQNFLLANGTGHWAIGDFDGNHEVDLDDFVTFKTYFMAETPPLESASAPMAPMAPMAAMAATLSAAAPAPPISDLDGDGDIDFDDFCILLAQTQGR